MIKYAREDVHYLLYIYDRMRQDLVTLATQNGLEPSQFLKSVLKKSCDICLQRYSKPKLKDESYYNLVLRNKMVLSATKVKLLKNLLKWRFKYAAIEDENPSYVLPNPTLFQLVEKQPKTTKEFYANFKKVGPILRKYDNELIAIINETSQEALPDFVEKKLEFSDIIPEIKLNSSSTKSLTVPQLQNEESNFKLTKSNVKIPNYIGNFIYMQNGKKETSSKLTEIKNSFIYENYIEYILDLHPQIKTGFKEAKEAQNQNATDSKLNEEKNDGNAFSQEIPNKKKDFDFIGFEHEKGAKQQIKKKEVALNIDQNKMMAELEKIKEIPKSLKEKYGTTLNDKKGKNKRNIPEDLEKNVEPKTMKKVKTDEKKGSFANKFEALKMNEKEESDEEMETKKQQSKKNVITDENLDEISKKIMSI